MRKTTNSDIRTPIWGS